jgi:hypothetical protein
MFSELKDFIIVQIMGSDGKNDPIARNAKMNTVIKARAFVIYQWLHVLREGNSLYEKCLSAELPDFDGSFREAINQCNDEVFDHAIHVKDQDSMNAEKIVGDDVAGERTGILDSSNCPEEEQSASGSSDEPSDEPNTVSYSYVVDEENMRNSMSQQVKKDNPNPNPLSEFEDLEELLVGAFPQVFMLGLACNLNKRRDEDEDEDA